MPRKIKDPKWAKSVEDFYQDWKLDYPYINFTVGEVKKFAHDYHTYMETGSWEKKKEKEDLFREVYKGMLITVNKWIGNYTFVFCVYEAINGKRYKWSRRSTDVFDNFDETIVLARKSVDNLISKKK